MTTREHILNTLHKHYIGKTFTSKDVAARAGASHCYTGKVLNELKHVELVEERPVISPRNVVLTLNRAKVYTFNPPKRRQVHQEIRHDLRVAGVHSKRELIERELYMNLQLAEFSCADIANKLGIDAKYVNFVLSDTRGVKVIRTEALHGSIKRNIFTFKPVSLDKWVV